MYWSCKKGQSIFFKISSLTGRKRSDCVRRPVAWIWMQKERKIWKNMKIQRKATKSTKWSENIFKKKYWGMRSALTKNKHENKEIGHPHIMLVGPGQIWSWRSFWRSNRPRNRFWPFLAKLLFTIGWNFAQDLFILGSTTLFYTDLCRRSFC